MSFDKLQYDVVLIETPTKYVVERYDQPKYPAIGVAYVGNYLEKNVDITPAIIDAKLGRKTIEETIKYVVALKPKIVGLSSMTHNIKVAANISFEIKKVDEQFFFFANYMVQIGSWSCYNFHVVTTEPHSYNKLSNIVAKIGP